jgi:repressor LexA
MPHPSPKQLEVLGFIEQFIADQGLPPTRGDIAEGLGLKNRQGIDQHLRALAGKGLIELVPGRSRGIRLLNPPDNWAASASSMRAAANSGLPLLGRIAAGSPILASSNIEDRLQIDPTLFKPHADFLLRVRGDSMKNADIRDGDLLAVHQTSQVHNGQIVIARLHDEATVKRFLRQGDRVRLEPENPAYQAIDIDLRRQELTIEGLAVGILRTGNLRAG